MEKRQPLQQRCWENWLAVCKKQKLDPCLSPCSSINSKWIKDINITPETLKLVQERVGNTLEVIGIGKDFLNRTLAAQQLREIIDKWDLIKLKSFRMTKVVSKLKRPPQIGRKILVSYTSDKRLITRIYRELKKLNSPKTNEPVKKWANKLNKTFSIEEIQMAKKHKKKFSPSLAIKEMQIKTTLRFHLILVRIAIIFRNTTSNRCWQGCGEKGTLIHCLWKCKLVQPLWKKIKRLLKTLNIDLPYNPAIRLLRLYPKDWDTGYSRGTCTPMFIAALFTMSKLWKQPRCPTTDKWIKKMWYLYTMEFY
jgi:hypothetical protein